MVSGVCQGDGVVDTFWPLDIQAASAALSSDEIAMLLRFVETNIIIRLFKKGVIYIDYPFLPRFGIEREN